MNCHQIIPTKTFTPLLSCQVHPLLFLLCFFQLGLTRAMGRGSGVRPSPNLKFRVVVEQSFAVVHRFDVIVAHMFQSSASVHLWLHERGAYCRILT